MNNQLTIFKYLSLILLFFNCSAKSNKESVVINALECLYQGDTECMKNYLDTNSIKYITETLKFDSICFEHAYQIKPVKNPSKTQGDNQVLCTVNNDTLKFTVNTLNKQDKLILLENDLNLLLKREKNLSYKIGESYYNKLEYLVARNWLLQSDTITSGRVLYLLGMTYYNSVDYVESLNSVPYFEKSFELGFYEGREPLTLLLTASGRRGEAIKLNKYLAERGDSSAMYELASIYDQFRAPAGYVFPDDWESNSAFKWYIKAAEHKNTSAMYFLGKFYEKGWGVSIDYKNAFDWYYEAAQHGDVGGMIMIAEYLIAGKGVEQNKEEAIKWCKQPPPKEVALVTDPSKIMSFDIPNKRRKKF